MINLSFKNLSIKKKFILSIMGISSVMLLSTLGIFITSDLINFKKTTLEDLSTLAELVGKNSSGPLMFYDVKAAEENLLALKAKPHIVSTHLFRDGTQAFAHYDRDNQENLDYRDREQLPPEIISLIKSKTEGYHYINDHIHLVKRIIFETDQTLLGLIHIESDRELYWQRITDYIYTILVIISTALLITLAFAFRVQKIFTDPILKLLTSMQHVSTEHNYTSVIKSNSEDEFGELISGYNNMLTQLEQHKQLSQHYQSDLEKRVEERTLQLKKARDEALSASRTKSIFLANMSHEIRTPMNAILGYAQLLQQGELNNNQARQLRIIDKSGNHLLELINDILELSKIEAGSMVARNSDFDLLELVRSIENMFKIRCDDKNIAWQMDFFRQKPVLVNGDQGKLRQILINLIGNACKFTEHGKVIFRIENITENRYKFTIQDTGTGIEEQALPRIFEAFHQERQGELKGGTGLGLNITKRHIELLRGNLQVTSRIGEGSTFFFDVELLPASKSFSSSEPAPIPIAFLKSDQQLTALVVDDIKDNTDLLSSILTQMGFSVVSAANGLEALTEIDRHCPDIIFMDIRMPVMDGIEAIEKIRQKYPSAQLKCIAVSASGLQHKSDYFIAKGYDLFISKPFRFEAIFSAISEVLQVELHYDDNTYHPVPAASPEKTKTPALKLEKEFIQELLHAAEYGQLTELGKLKTRLNDYGQDGIMAANHLELLINSADLDGILEYVEAVINE